MVMMPNRRAVSYHDAEALIPHAVVVDGRLQQLRVLLQPTPASQVSTKSSSTGGRSAKALREGFDSPLGQVDWRAEHGGVPKGQLTSSLSQEKCDGQWFTAEFYEFEC